MSAQLIQQMTDNLIDEDFDAVCLMIGETPGDYAGALPARCQALVNKFAAAGRVPEILSGLFTMIPEVNWSA